VADLDEAFVGVVERLRGLLGDARGKLRAQDALTLAGFKSPSYQRSQLVARALRSLGWERGRYRFRGKLRYAYARGTPLEREAMLDIERGEDDLLIVRQREL